VRVAAFFAAIGTAVKVLATQQCCYEKPWLEKLKIILFFSLLF
jgi:hypothetical protein